MPGNKEDRTKLRGKVIKLDEKDGQIYTHNDSIYTGRYSWTLACSASVHKLHGPETTAALAQLSEQEKNPVGRAFTFRCHSLLTQQSVFQTKAYPHPPGSEKKS